MIVATSAPLRVIRQLRSGRDRRARVSVNRDMAASQYPVGLGVRSSAVRKRITSGISIGIAATSRTCVCQGDSWPPF